MQQATGCASNPSPWLTAFIMLHSFISMARAIISWCPMRQPMIHIDARVPKVARDCRVRDFTRQFGWIHAPG